MNMKKLHLGSGKDIRKGYINLDSVKLNGVDVVHNLDKYPWPFKNNQFDEVLCINVLEHLSSIVDPMEEIWRISKPGAKVIIRVPIYPSIWAFTDPTHKSVYTYVTFNYFRPEDGLNYYTKARFRIIKRRIRFLISYLKPLEWFFNINEKMQKFYSFYLSMIIPARELYFELEVLK